MTRFIRHNTVGLVALFVALGGTGYAATQLPYHSVGTRQLRNHSVTPAKLAKNAKPVTKRELRQAITQVVSDPATGLNITLSAKDGAPGLDGATGPVGPTGPQGPKGDQGAKGDKGDKGDIGQTGASGTAATYGFIDASGAATIYGDSPTNYTRIINGSQFEGVYCFSNGALTSLVVSPAARGATAVVLPASEANDCLTGWYEVVTMVSGVSADAPFYFAGN